MMYFLVSFSLIFPPENSKELSFGLFRSVGRFLNTHCGGFFSLRSPRRGISPLSIYDLIIRQGFAGLTPPIFWLLPSPFLSQQQHYQGYRLNIALAKVDVK